MRDDAAPADVTRALEKAGLRALATRYPGIDAAVGRIAALSAELTLPKGVVHVISDVHGEDVKLRHVINNASGTLRPLVERLFADRDEGAHAALLTLLFYPSEALERSAPPRSDRAARVAFVQRTLNDLFVVLRALADRYPLATVRQRFPIEYNDLLGELLHEPTAAHGDAHLAAAVGALETADRALHLIRLVVRVVRDLAVSELIVAGDLVDRGPRGDRVIEYLRRQPDVTITWGNHDIAWMGAGLGHDALIAHVLRLSIRYRRLSQLEEGYGITLQPLEHLVRTVYGEDPAPCHRARGDGLREPQMMARMQKAAAILQYKLEGQAIARNPHWQLDHRRVMRGLDLEAGTVTLDGRTHPLRDPHLPTVDPSDPERLSEAEACCLERTRQSFLQSARLWQHIRFLVERGAMYLRRDDHLIFHGCVPADADGCFRTFEVEGKPLAGRALFEALERVVVRAVDAPTEADLDLFWYLWCGPRSPLFGKDRITTFERDFVEDAATHHETKDPYFTHIHEVGFCERVLAEFDADPARGLIVNGHVPVKLDDGESPMKRSGRAVTIDGAFSPAYGDHGFTLVLEADRTYLARHHHFDSVQAAVEQGLDIIPTVTAVRTWDPPRRVADTERGSLLRAEIALLERLIEAYRTHALRAR